jgi:predicted dithiol-disulfide oxidoreductase (DUF899 family)
MNTPPIVSPQEWEAAREELLVKEKELTRARDALAAERRRMPRMAVEKDYRFEGRNGPAELLDLFAGRRQLIIYRFFFEPARMGWEQIPWYTLTDDFDADFGVAELHGTNAFFRDGERIFRTYFINERGDEALGSTFSYLDMTALGRQEEWEDSPEGYPQTPRAEGATVGWRNWGPYRWWNLHDEYGKGAA